METLHPVLGRDVGVDVTHSLSDLPQIVICEYPVADPNPTGSCEYLSTPYSGLVPLRSRSGPTISKVKYDATYIYLVFAAHTSELLTRFELRATGCPFLIPEQARVVIADRERDGLIEQLRPYLEP